MRVFVRINRVISDVLRIFGFSVNKSYCKRSVSSTASFEKN